MIIPATAAWSSDTVELFLLHDNDVTDAYVGWLNDPLVNSYLESRFEEHTLESTRAYVRACVDRENSLLLGIRYLDGHDRHVGNIKVDINSRHGLGEVGILIGEKSAHGKGIGSEAIRIVTQIARTELGLRKLTAGCYGSNKGSERAFIKAGFEVEGARPEHVLRDGEPESITLMGMLL
jgi:RimJ/RimL family protein N-acetyltransferase